LPTTQQEQASEVDNTPWGVVPREPIVVNAFANDPNSRVEQDIGLDGLNDARERTKYAGYLNQISGLSNAAEIEADPAL